MIKIEQRGLRGLGDDNGSTSQLFTSEYTPIFVAAGILAVLMWPWGKKGSFSGTRRKKSRGRRRR